MYMSTETLNIPYVISKTSSPSCIHVVALLWRWLWPWPCDLLWSMGQKQRWQEQRQEKCLHTEPFLSRCSWKSAVTTWRSWASVLAAENPATQSIPPPQSTTSQLQKQRRRHDTTLSTDLWVSPDKASTTAPPSLAHIVNSQKHKLSQWLLF